MMSARVLRGALVAAGLMAFAGDAGAANLTWNLSSSASYQISNSSGTFGNVRIFRSVEDPTELVRVTSWSAPAVSTTFGTAFTGRWSGGLGATNKYPEDTGTNQHTVDNSGNLDLIMFQFETAMVMNEAFMTVWDCGCGAYDSDLSIWIGNTNTPFNQTLNLAPYNYNTLVSALGFTQLTNNDSSGATSRTASFNGGNLEGNVLIIAASISNPDSKADKVKIKTISGNTGGGGKVPEPGALGIVLLGLAGVAFIRRRSGSLLSAA